MRFSKNSISETIALFLLSMLTISVFTVINWSSLILSFLDISENLSGTALGIVVVFAILLTLTLPPVLLSFSIPESTNKRQQTLQEVKNAIIPDTNENDIEPPRPPGKDKNQEPDK